MINCHVWPGVGPGKGGWRGRSALDPFAVKRQTPLACSRSDKQLCFLLPSRRRRLQDNGLDASLTQPLTVLGAAHHLVIGSFRPLDAVAKGKATPVSAQKLKERAANKTPVESQLPYGEILATNQTTIARAGSST